VTTLTAVEPFVWVPPGARGSYVEEVAGMAETYGRPLDPLQFLAVEAMESYGPGGLPLTLEQLIKGPRQSVGKTGGIITASVFSSLFTSRPDDHAWTAHLFKTTRKAFLDHHRLIEGCAELSKRVKRINESHGEESIELINGAKLEYLARSKGGGRGMSGKIVVIDEALFFGSEAAAALLPTLATRPDARVLYASSACKVESDLLRKLTRRGRSQSDPSLIMVEHKAKGEWADPGCVQGKECFHVIGTYGCQLDNHERWMEANPMERVTLKFLEDMRRTFDPLEFGREFLGWDEPGKDDLAHPINGAVWASLASAGPGQGDYPNYFISIGLDASAVISVSYGRSPGTLYPDSLLRDERPHLELADRIPVARLNDRLEELDDRWEGARFGASRAGPVAGMVKTASLSVPVELFPNEELAQASRHLENMTNSRGFTHSADPDVDTSLMGAVSKPHGDGLWLWDWRKSVNLAPIASETGALWMQEKYGNAAPSVLSF
jgi:hypothetical protein